MAENFYSEYVSKLMDEIKEVNEKQLDFPSLCHWFLNFSIKTWEMLHFAFRHSYVKMHETTITQMLVFEFWALSAQIKYPIFLYESKDEKANGNDLEMVVETSKGHLIMPVQAKVIKKGWRYTTIKQKNKNNKYQADLLIDYATRIKGLPLYLFYNYCDDLTVSKVITDVMGMPNEFFGCSVADARKVRDKYCRQSIKSSKSTWSIPGYGDLHPSLALPFHYLTCHDLNT